MDHYYVNPVCSPTRASIMSGRSAMHHGIQTPYSAGNDASGLNLSYTILPEALKEVGNYTSYMVGKWYVVSYCWLHVSCRCARAYAPLSLSPP